MEPRFFTRTANRIAPKWTGSVPADDEELRDFIDIETGGELNAVQLDILTDMVAQRIDTQKRADDMEARS